MKWTVITIFALLILSYDARTEDDVIDQKAIEKETVLKGETDVDSETHSHVNIYSQESNSDGVRISDISEQKIVPEQIQKMECEGNPEQNPVNEETVDSSVGGTNLQEEGLANQVSDDISHSVKEVTDNVQEQSEELININTKDSSMDADESREAKENDISGVTSKADEIEENSQDEESHTGTSSKKQRYFPLLYTVGSMFTSFLAEFGEVSGSSDSSSSNSSSLKNVTLEDGLALSTNSTSNSTDQGKKTRFQCALHLKNTTNELNGTAMVKIINSTELLEILNFSKNQKSAASPCVLVMFYTKWCQFSARAAPEYNALARAFPQLDVLAVDTSHFSYLNAKFGTVAVPNIMIFHSRSAVRFNHTTRDLDHFIQFVHNNTGLDPSSSVAVLPEDFEGPLSSTVVQGRDWLLWLAWAFILVCSIYMFFFSLYGQAVIMRLRVLWAEHQHIE